MKAVTEETQKKQLAVGKYEEKSIMVDNKEVKVVYNFN